MSRLVHVTGATRLYAIIGDPIAQVRSPEIFCERFAEMGIDAVLVPVHVPDRSFDDVVPALLRLGNLDGVLVTVPFKPRMLPFADRLGATARIVGAVNALRREADDSWTGDMFDGVGFVRGAERKGERIRGRRVALFGAGGAGSAIACALAEAGAKSITVVDTNAPKAEALVAKLGTVFPECRFAVANGLSREADMVMNATTVGMRPDDGLPAEIGPLDPGTLVGDVVIRGTPTPLIGHAMRYGCRFVDGRDMHGGQVEAILGFFEASSRSAALQTVSSSS